MGKIEDNLTPEQKQAFDNFFDEALNEMVECGMITKTNENGTDYYSFQPSKEKDECKTKKERSLQKMLEKYEGALCFAHAFIEHLNEIIANQKKEIKALEEKNKLMKNFWTNTKN